MRRQILFFFSLAIFFFVGRAQSLVAQTSGCFSLVAGRNTTADGAVLLAHNEDDSGEQVVILHLQPAIQEITDEPIRLLKGGLVAPDPTTAGYLWLQMPGMLFSDSYVNCHAVSIVSNACPSRETDGEIENGGISFWLRRLLAERAHSARHAVQLAGHWIETYGYDSSGRTYIIADRDEGWMLAVVQGKHWAAARVPNDHVAVIPNHYTLGYIDLSDTTHFLGSSDLIDYAEQRGWYDSEKDGLFHFSYAYSDPRALATPTNHLRMWSAVNLLAAEPVGRQEPLPFSFRPKKLLTPGDLMRVLRDHYEDTDLDSSQSYRLGNPHELNGHPICNHTTQYGLIAQLRRQVPDDLGAVIWIAPRRPDVQAFIPWTVHLDSLPAAYTMNDPREALELHFSGDSLRRSRGADFSYFVFSRLCDRVDQDYFARLPFVRNAWRVLEEDALKSQSEFEARLGSDAAERRRALTRRTFDYADRALRMANKLIQGAPPTDKVQTNPH